MLRHDYFICYSGEDRGFARQLARQLGHDGTRGVLDQDDISAGADWSQSIKTAIENSEAIIVIMSHSATSSNWILAEIGMAQALGKPIIPVLVPGAVVDESVFGLLDRYQVLDAASMPVEEVSARIVSATRKVPLAEAKRLLPLARRSRRLSLIWSLAALLLLLSVTLYFMLLPRREKVTMELLQDFIGRSGGQATMPYPMCVCTDWEPRPRTQPYLECPYWRICGDPKHCRVVEDCVIVNADMLRIAP